MSKVKFKELQLIAFWKHDKFPFCLYGKVTEIDERGYVQTIEYGPGRCFKPVIILPIVVAEAVIGNLKKLEDEYNKARSEVDKEFRITLLKTIPFMTDVLK